MDTWFSVFVIIILIAGSALLAFYSENIKKFVEAVLFAFILSVIEYWIVGNILGLSAYVWGVLFIITVFAKLWGENKDDGVNSLATA